MKPEEFRQMYDLVTLDDEADCRILSGIGKMKTGGKNMRNRRYQKKYVKAAVAAAVAILAVGSGGYAASLVWNANVAERFGVEDQKEIMQELSDKGFSKKLAGENTAGSRGDSTGDKSDVLSVTDKGITVTLRQTLADENCGYIYYEVEYGEEYAPVMEGTDERSDYGIAWPEAKLTTDRVLNYSGGIMKVINDHKVGYEYFFSPADHEKTFQDNVMNLKIKSFYMETKKAGTEERIAEGDWSLSWKLSNGNQKRVYQIDKTVKIDGMDIHFEKFEVSPLSCRVVYLAVEDKKFMELSGKMEEPGLGMLRCGKKTFQGNGGGGYMSPTSGKNGKTYIVEQKVFDKILDVGTLTGFYFGNKLISLENIEYTVED